MKPLVSVLMPVYNSEATLHSAIASILRQSERDFELIAVNDGSSDLSSAILDDFARLDPRIRPIHMPHSGIIEALNTGITHCEGEFIARMDADDISHPRRLEMQCNLLQTDIQTHVCSSMVCMFPQSAIPGGLVRYGQWLNSLITPMQIGQDMFVESPIAHPSVMIRRSHLTALGGYQENGWPEDYDLWLRCHLAGYLFAKVQQPLLFWRQSDSRLTFTDGRYSVENFLRAKAHYLAQLLKCIDRPILLWGSGQTGRRLSKHLLREGLTIDAVIDIDPSKTGRALKGMPIIALSEVASYSNPYIIAAVSSHRSRALIRAALHEMGLSETTDFVCAA